MSFSFAYATNAPGSGLPFRIQAWPTNLFPGTYLAAGVLREPLYYQTDTNGNLTLTNLAPFEYVCSIGGGTNTATVTTFWILVPNTNATIAFSTILAAPTNQPNAGTVGYSQAAANAIFVQQTNGVSTNQTLNGGVNIGTTNLPTYISSVANSLIVASNGMTSIRSFGAVGGGADDTAAFQAAAFSGKDIWVDNSGYIVSNVVFTNNTHFFGNHAWVGMKNGAPGDEFLVASGLTNVVIKGIVFDGQKWALGTGAPLNYTTPWTTTPDFTMAISLSDAKTAFPVSPTNRVGLHICSNTTNGVVENCSANNFSDAGYRLDGYGSSGEVPTWNNLVFANNSASYDWIGVDTTNGAEYITLNNCYIYGCGRAYSIQSGNVDITGGLAVSGGDAFYCTNAPNGAHGTAIGVNCNHNYMFAECQNFAAGEYFVNCTSLGGGAVLVTNCTDVRFIGCTFPGPSSGIYGSATGIDMSFDGGAGNSSGLNWLENCFEFGWSRISITHGSILAQIGNTLAQQTLGPTNQITNSVPMTYTSTNIFTGSVTSAVPVNFSYQGTSNAVNEGTSATNGISYDGGKAIWLDVNGSHVAGTTNNTFQLDNPAGANLLMMSNSWFGFGGILPLEPFEFRVDNSGNTDLTLQGKFSLLSGVTLVGINDAYSTYQGLELLGSSVQLTTVGANPINFAVNLNLVGKFDSSGNFTVNAGGDFTNNSSGLSVGTNALPNPTNVLAVSTAFQENAFAIQTNAIITANYLRMVAPSNAPTATTNAGPGLGVGASVALDSGARDAAHYIILTVGSGAIANTGAVRIAFGKTAPAAPYGVTLTIADNSSGTGGKYLNFWPTNFTTSGYDIWTGTNAPGQSGNTIKLYDKVDW